MFIALVIFSLIAAPILSIYSKKAFQRGVSPAGLVLATAVIGLIFFTPLLVYVHPDITLSLIWIVVAIAGFKLLAAWPINESTKMSDVSFITQFSSFEIIFALLFGWLLLHEQPSAGAFLGIVVVICGSFLLTRTSPTGHWIKAIVLRFIGAILFALSSIFLRKFVTDDTFTLGILAYFTMGLISIPAFIVGPGRSTHQRAMLRKNIGLLFFVSVLAVAVFLAQAYLFAAAQVSYIFAIFQLGLILNVILAGNMLKEKNYLKRLVPAGLIIVGVIIIYYTR